MKVVRQIGKPSNFKTLFLYAGLLCDVLAQPRYVFSRYLEEAIMNLDTSNPVTREHLPGVVRELQQQIMGFLASNPGHALTRQFRMLLMAADSLVKSTVWQPCRPWNRQRSGVLFVTLLGCAYWLCIDPISGLKCNGLLRCKYYLWNDSRVDDW